MDCSMPGFLVHPQLPELAQTHGHWVGDAIQPFHPLSSTSPPAFKLSQHQGLFQWGDSSHQVAKVLELYLQHQSFQWIFKTDFLYDWLVGSPCSPRDSQESSPNFTTVQKRHFFTSGGQSIGVSASAFVLPMNIQDWFPLGWTGLISLQSKGLPRVFSNTQFKSTNSLAFSLLYVPTSFDQMDLCQQSNVFLVFNMLSRLVIAFLPRSKHLLISWLQSPSDFRAQKNKGSHCFHCFPIYFPWSDGTGCHDLRFLNVEL